MLPTGKSANYIGNYNQYHLPFAWFFFLILFSYYLFSLQIYLACTATYSECLVGQKIVYCPQQVVKNAEFWSEQLTAALFNYSKYSCTLQSKGALVNHTYFAFLLWFLWLYESKNWLRPKSNPSPSHMKPFCQDFSLKHIIIFVVITFYDKRRQAHSFSVGLL